MSSDPPFPDRDYVSPGLEVVTLDAQFPRMQPGDRWSHPWKYLRREIPHRWYVDERFPLMGFLNRDEATILYNIALQFRGKRCLEIGSWLGWSTAHLAMAGVEVDVIDPAHADPALRAIAIESLSQCEVTDRVHLMNGRSPETVHELASELARKWSLFFIDGDHEAPAPLRDTLACRPYAEDDCAFVFHDLASPAVADAFRFLQDDGFHVLLYQTAQIMGLAWRGDVRPVQHIPDPEVAWQIPHHLVGFPVAGVDLQDPLAGIARPARSWGSFASLATTAQQSTPSVCIVTNEVIGPFKNGGVGTAMTGLAETLAAAGMPVTILYTGNLGPASVGLDGWRKHYAEMGIELDALTAGQSRRLEGPLKNCGFGTPWLVYEYLAARRFDVVHFNDCCGEGSLALAAKRLGLAFHDTLLVLALHSPSQWVLEQNHVLPHTPLLSAYRYSEQLSVKCADVLWSPSRYMLGWASDQDFTIPEQSYVQQYSIPSPGCLRAVHYGRTARPKEIVFFGRLEERKGLRLFCNAIDSIRQDLASRGISVTFLGKEYMCAGMNSLDYIAGRSNAWPFPVRMLTNLGQREALDYLTAGEKLAVMPSPLDNSPCTVYEALLLGVPFLASATGGIPELVHEDDRSRVLFAHSTEALRSALGEVIDHGGWIARPAVPQDEVRKSWSQFHANWRGHLPAHSFLSSAGPSRVVAFVDHRPGANLDATLKSLESCNGVRTVVVLDRENPGSMDDAVAALADDAVLLIHSGVVVKSEPLARMLTALRCEGVDGFLPAASIQDGESLRVVPPLGGSAPFAFFEGVTFTGGLLVRSEALLRATSRRPIAVESAFLGLADLCTIHCDLWPFPEAVFELGNDWKFEVKGGLPARVAAYDECSATDRYYMLATGYGAAHPSTPFFGTREIAMVAINHGLGLVVRLGMWGLRQARRVRRLLSRMR